VAVADGERGTMTLEDENRDIVDDLRRWVESGAVWRVVHRTPGRVTVALLRCDGGEEAGRLTSTHPRTLRFVADAAEGGAEPT
jgi:hypothetical protein